MQLSEITKSIVTAATLIVSIGTLVLHGSLPANVATGISIAVGAAGLVVHYLAPNTTDDPQVAATQSVRLKTRTAA